MVEEVDKLQHALPVSVDSPAIPLHPSPLPTSIPYTPPPRGILALEIPLNDYTFQILSQNLLPDYRDSRTNVVWNQTLSLDVEEIYFSIEIILTFSHAEKLRYS